MNVDNSAALSSEDIEKVYSLASSIIAEIEKAVTGKHKEIVLLVTALAAGGHVLIEDVPGVGKTTLASALAKAAGLDFRRAQFTPDVTASDITGFNIYNRSTESFEFREGLVMTNILLADEINRASPKTQSSLLEAMEENSVTVDGKTYQIPDPFMVIATQNPAGYIGTYPLPEAQLDRFMIRLTIGYPSPEDETEIIRARRTSNPLDFVQPVSSRGVIKLIRAVAQHIKVSESLCRYMVDLVSCTRNDKLIALGASPRATLMLMRMSQAYAFMQKREYVVPEDIAAVFDCTIAHRIILSQEAKLNRIGAEKVLDSIFKRIKVPFGIRQ
ncbi:MAG: MoxR family ATPase [Firmicutes bacterium]|nr:MoxR family ATPase [Bacillota bacterium]